MTFKMPPLTMKDLMAVFRAHSRIPPAFLYTSWKDGIDIDEPSPLAQEFAEHYGRAVLEAVAAWLETEHRMTSIGFLLADELRAAAKERT